MDDLLNAMREMQQKLDAMPPVVARLYATHSVPYGRVFRMWTTRGELIAYVNRGQIADMPRAKAEPVRSCIAVPVLPASITGIPVYNE